MKAITLWLGMYTITAILFYLETESIGKGLSLGLLSASLKTVWSLVHSKLYTKKPALEYYPS